jgi:hypothetical protein
MSRIKERKRVRPFHFGKLSVWVNCDAIAEEEQEDERSVATTA